MQIHFFSALVLTENPKSASSLFLFSPKAPSPSFSLSSLMATARDESSHGAGGKFQKRPFRRSTQTTPYDRPPTAVRNPTNFNINNNNGWLSKLVDPAQRLIVSSAHRLFASVFRKRLTPPLPPEPESKHEETNMYQEQVSTDHAGVQGAIGSHDDLNNSSPTGGLIELEQILKQKTFSRSEVDRLTALLQSRTAEMPVRDEQRSPEAILSKPVVLRNRKEAALDTPCKENGISNQPISTPVASSTVLDEDIASPAELAKAYMGSRPSKVSLSMLGVHGQASREQSTVLGKQPLPSASPVFSLVPRSSGHVAVPENVFVTPRSRGRSAIYSMARAPYSRVHSTTDFKGAGLTNDSVSGPSPSPQSTWEKNRLTGSKQGSLKRRSSFLDSDIGSVGPVRRIRQKSNLLSSKSLSLAASGSLSLRGSGVADNVQYPSYSLQKPLLLSEPKDGLTKLFIENGDNSFPSTSTTPISSKSSEMASKILQQLDKLVSSREKSPTKLSPSMLHGPALKSLENVDSSIFMENIQDNNRSNGSLDTPLPDVRDSSSQKQDKVEENGPTKIFSPKLIPATNVADAAGIIRDNLPSAITIDSALTNSMVHPQSQKKRAFQMSAHEDYLELDDDDYYSNGPPSMPLADGRDKPNASLDDKTTAAEAITVEKSPASSDFKETNDGAIVAGKGPVFTFSTVPSPSMLAQPDEIATLSTLTSNKAANESSGSIFSFGEKFASPKESNAVSPSFSTFTNVDKVPQFTSTSSSTVINEPPICKFGAPLNSKPESLTSLASDAVGATDSVTIVPASDKADNRVSFRTPESSFPSAASTSSSTASIFSFGAPANGSPLNNGSLASCPSSTSSSTPPLFSNAGFNQNLFSNSTISFATTNSVATSVTTSSATTPSTAASIFKFGSSPATSISPLSATSGTESTEAKKNKTSFGNSTSELLGASSAFAGTGISTSSSTSFATTGTGCSIFGGTLADFSTTGSSTVGDTLAAFSTTGSSTFGGTSSATTSTGSSIFAGSSPPITSTGNSSFGGTSSTVANTGSSIFGFGAGVSTTAAPSQGGASNSFAAGNAEASVNVTSVTTTTQSMPTQFGSTASSTSFGLAANPTFSSSSSIFGSSTSATKAFDSVPSFGLSSSTEANSISSSTTSLFGSGWQSPQTSLFGSTFNSTSPSTAFPFGASASSATSSSAASAAVFESSANGSSSSIFPFTSAATATSSQPAFGNENSVFAFGYAPSNNNDQMTIEDSMAEDTVPTLTPAVSAFGQQPISPPSGFVFGSTSLSGANSFQFGSQQNLSTPQNPSPFQASSSLDFNAGGSFSLGSGGGDKSQRRMVKVRKPRKK